MDFSVLADHRVKLKESKTKDKYLDFAKKLKKKICDMKVMVIPIVIGSLRTIPKGLVKGLKDLVRRGRVETIQTTTFLGLARILGRVLET